MDIRCPRCGAPAEAAGHEDARAFYECRKCNRVWATMLSALAGHSGRHGDHVRVLIVDDSPETARLLTAWLEDEGCAVFTAGSGSEALDAAAVYYPDVVFLDLILPGPDGFQVCNALRRQHLPPEMILMTGYSNPEYARRGAEMGVVALLQKPLTREAVVATLTTALDRCRRDPLSGLRAHFGAHPRQT
jgi:CheY-like chemotaxis protein